MSHMIIADARKVSAADFLAGLTGRTMADIRADALARCVRRIDLGLDLYGKPPMLVDEARAFIAKRDQ